MKSLLNDDTAQYLEKIDYTSTWSVAHHMRFLMFAHYIVANNCERVLDVGFGQNVLVKYLQDAGFTGTYVGIDLNEEYVHSAIADSYKNGYNFEISYFRTDVHSASEFYRHASDDIYILQGGESIVERTDKKFDCIVLGEIVEHVDKDKVVVFLNDCKKMLAIGGAVLLSTPNKIDGKINWPEDHVNEFEYDELISVCSEAGLSLDEAFGLWNNTKNTKETLLEGDKVMYEKASKYIPTSILNVMLNLVDAKKSRALLLVLNHTTYTTS